MQAWVSYVHGHSALVRRLNAEMLEAHGLGLNDYEVMLRLWYAPDHQMRRIDLAESVLLTASGITRLLDRLQAAGYVDKALLPHRRAGHLRGADRAGHREVPRSPASPTWRECSGPSASASPRKRPPPSPSSWAASGCTSQQTESKTPPPVDE